MTTAQFDPAKPLVVAQFKSINGHSMTVGNPVTIVEGESTERGKLTAETAEWLWHRGVLAYAGEARPTPVESPQQSAARLVELEPLDGGWYLIRAPWLEEAEKVQGKEAADARVAELIAAGDPRGPAPSAPVAPLASAPGNDATGSGSGSGEPVTAFTAREAGSNGWFEITGPGLDEPIRLRGQKAVDEKLAELNKTAPPTEE